MGRIGEKFKELGERREKALITFVSAGDPDPGKTEEIVLALEHAGADIVELGVPFSDATADGPAIQASSARALRAGTSLRSVLATVKEVRKRSEIPIVLFGYYNPIHAYGPTRFARDSALAGVDGVLVVDLPFEESRELRRFTDSEGIDFIPLVAPTTGVERAGKVLRDGRGFVYFISVTGITGTAKGSAREIESRVRELRGVSRLPVAVGFGITNPADAAEIAPHADGIVVGSALVRLIHENRENGRLGAAITTFVGDLKKALTL
ncbi:MAG: tryptophan synthase subunit alpha [Desulfobacteraceae bacterium]|nr:MAG: tryptophan synthase subunit alpha [Desulfobacteraceae bacterium]